MKTLPGLIAIYLVTALCLILSGSTAYCALPPGSYDKMKAEASEVLKVEILSTQNKPQDGNFMDVIFIARVIEVKRSKTQLKKGQDISIHSYHATKPLRGPVNPPLLAQGWTGTVYLNKGTGKPENEGKKNDYCIAAYGRSFEKHIKGLTDKEH